MFEIIPRNTAVAGYRRIYFTLVDSSDFVTPEDIAVTGVKANLSFNGGAPAASTNDIVKVAGTVGEYYIELTQPESNTALGIIRGWLAPAGCALTKFQGTIVSDDVFAAALTASGLAQQIFKEDLAPITGEAARSLLNFVRSGLPLNRINVDNVAKTITVYKEDDLTIANAYSYTGNITSLTQIDKT